MLRLKPSHGVTCRATERVNVIIVSGWKVCKWEPTFVVYMNQQTNWNLRTKNPNR